MCVRDLLRLRIETRFRAAGRLHLKWGGFLQTGGVLVGDSNDNILGSILDIGVPLLWESMIRVSSLR